MSGQPPMATPLHSLPKNPNPSAPLDDDPMVQAVLDDIEHQMQQNPHAQQHQQAPQQQHSGPYPPSTVVMPVTPQQYYQPVQHQQPQQQVRNETNKWWKPEVAQRAVIAAVIAFIMFHPSILTPVYRTSPIAARFESYDSYIRIALLAVVLYILLVKFNL